MSLYLFYAQIESDPTICLRPSKRQACSFYTIHLVSELTVIVISPEIFTDEVERIIWFVNNKL